ncbi:cytochrome P450 [Thamnocephalis sphaerospora]|uniref:Cytochrome P450 n=1 Tax=Thamnocephalis sphaerospora TaxID=78915 RepID=A0A4P9XKR2_9FUNG|nr:cytochrome P450 [Thamnocephalis sphaerospora]|eukprot:RKP05870.1 cytochrome P450 [Thamnocephalis sphaerospora]
MGLSALLTTESVLVLAASYCAYTYISNKVVSPLRKVPGRWYNAVSSIPYNILLMRGEQLEYVDQLHREYGPVVRVTPDIISVADADVAHEVYRTHKFAKGPIYDGFDLAGGPNLFSMRNLGDGLSEFKLRKRLMAPAFTLSALPNLEPMVERAGTLPLLRALDKYAESGETANMMNLFMRATFSVMGEVSFGKSFNLIEQDHPILEWMAGMLELSVLKFAVGPLAIEKLFPHLFQCHKNTIEFALKAIKERRERKDARPDALQRYLDATDVGPGEVAPLSELDVVGEVLVQMVAGTDTAASTLSWAVHRLLAKPETLERLQAELDEVIPSPDTHITHDMVANLPYLNAVLSETLRVHPVGAGEPQRCVPEGGFTVGGYFLPAGTILMPGQYPLHHLDKVWPEPFEFKPERWLVGSEELHEMKRHFFPFSMGVRACVGRHLAWMELRVMLASIVRRYDMARVPGDDMTPKYQLVVRPRGEQVSITLQRRTC